MLDRAVAAMGGAEIVDQVTTLHLVGRSTRELAGGRVDTSTVRTVIAFPDRFRQEIEGRVGPLATLLNHDGAFLAAVGMLLPLPVEQRDWMAASLRRNPLRLLQLRAELELGGTSMDAGGPLERVEAVLGDDRMVLGFDSDSGLLVLVTVPEATVPESGTGEYSVTFDDWREVGGGLLYPFVSSATFDGRRVFRTELDTVAVNPTVRDDLFASAALVLTPTEEGAAPPAP